METTAVNENTSRADWVSALRRPPILGLLLILLMAGEKMLAHTYTVITIYVLPEPWKYWIPALMGCVGVWLILRGMGKDEVKGTLLGYLGAVLIWMSWFESGLPLLAAYDQIPRFLPEEGNRMAGLLGEHVILQASGIFCFVTLFFIMLNKDVRCRMLVWIRRKLKMEVVGKPTQAYRPNVARVAAFEYLYVTWFMYVIMLILIDPRLFGLHHPVTYIATALIVSWGLYLAYKLTRQREVGLSIRYAIGTVGVLWYIPEIAALYEVFYEFYLYVDRHPIAMALVLASFIFILRVLWKTPVDPKTGRSRNPA
jgi:hypothetical protein